MAFLRIQRMTTADVCVGYPKLKVVMMHSSKFFLSMKPRFNRTRRRRESLLKVLLLSFLSNGARKLDGILTTDGSCCGRCDVGNVEPAHNTKDTLPQLNSEVVNPTGFADHKVLNVWCGKQCLQ